MMGMEINVLKRTIDGSGTMTLDLALGVANVGTLKINSVQETDAMGNMENTFDGKQSTKAAAAATSEPKYAAATAAPAAAPATAAALAGFLCSGGLSSLGLMPGIRVRSAAAAERAVPS